MTDNSIGTMIDYRLAATKFIRISENERKEGNYLNAELYMEASEHFEQKADFIAEELNRWRERNN